MSGILLWVSCGPKENANTLFGAFVAELEEQHKRRCRIPRICPVSSAGAVADPSRSSEEKIYEVVLKQAALVRVREQKKKDATKRALDLDNKRIELGDFANVDLLNAAYDRCGEVCAEYTKTFYLDAIRDGYNPATWMLEVTSSAKEMKLGIDFAEAYKNSDLYRRNEALIKELSIPASVLKDAYSPSSPNVWLAYGNNIGLTGAILSNWFINARVRLWRPMIEEMYKEEFGDSSEDSNPPATNNNYLGQRR